MQLKRTIVQKTNSNVRSNITFIVSIVNNKFAFINSKWCWFTGTGGLLRLQYLLVHKIDVSPFAGHLKNSFTYRYIHTHHKLICQHFYKHENYVNNEKWKWGEGRKRKGVGLRLVVDFLIYLRVYISVKNWKISPYIFHNHKKNWLLVHKL